MKKVMISVLFISLFLIPGQGFALSCAEPPPPDIAYDEHDAVVIGSIKEIDRSSGKKKLMIDVEKSYKGVSVNKITVYEDPTWGESQEGATYLFFLDKDEGKWLHPLCSPTTHNTDSADEHFADQKELPLQSVESYASDSDNTLAILMIAALLLGISAAMIWIVPVKNAAYKFWQKQTAQTSCLSGFLVCIFSARCN